MIKKLDRKSIQNICANQVILDISACVKELLENSLDANSSVIEINLKDFGQESIIVKDNGIGITKTNFSTIIQKGATSKITNFDDLNVITSYGFRGEALNALNQISDLTIMTRTKEENYGYKLKFNKENELILQEEIALDYGTTVILEKIYQNFPVRLLDLKNNFKSHYSKILALIIEYSLISLNTKIIMYNETKEKSKEMIINNGHSNDVLSNRILRVLGKKIIDALIEFQCNLNETFSIKGFILKNINSGSGNENVWLKKHMTYFYLNSRPINPPKKFFNVLADLYKQYNSNSKFIAILNFEVKNENVDYNLSPDKREIYLQNEKDLVEIFKTELYSFHERLYSFQKIIDNKNKNQAKLLQKKTSFENYSFLNNSQNLNSREKKMKISEQGHFVIKSRIIDDSYDNSTKGFIENKEQIESFAPHLINKQNEINKYSIKYYEPQAKIEKKNELDEIKAESDNKTAINKRYSMRLFELPSKSEDIMLQKKKLSDSNENSFSTQLIINSENENKETQEKNQKYFDINIFEPKNINLDISLSNSEEMPALIPIELENNLINQTNISFNQESFSDLSVIGQFNLGFIISYYKPTNDIYIIDQHAADEKTNYEKLINEYKFQSQLLINPLKLTNLTDIDIHTIKENYTTFEKNGFSLILDKENSSNFFFLKSLPCFKNVQFTLDDFYELLKNIHNSYDNYSKELIRPRKFKTSIAFKACRGSLMVGDCLTKKEMKTVVSKLSELKSPWNCPHGRPTMVKSENLSLILMKIKVKRTNFK